MFAGLVLFVRQCWRVWVNCFIVGYFSGCTPEQNSGGRKNRARFERA